MDRLVDHLFVFEGEGVIRDFPGNYSQFREMEKIRQDTPIEEKKLIDPKPSAESDRRKMGFKEQREFEMLQKELSELEKEKKLVTEKLAHTGLAFDELERLSRRIGEITAAIDEKELRWLELSEWVS